MKGREERPRVAARLAAAGLAIFAVGGCAGKYLYGSLEEVVAQPKGKGCAFTLIEALPDKPYDSLGVVAPADIELGGVAKDADRFHKAIDAQVCAAGGDAVVAERDRQGRYVRGTVIKFK